MGQRRAPWGDDPKLRAWLLEDCKAFRREMCSKLAENPAWSSEAWRQLSRSVDALAAGKPYRFHGWELPDDHPARAIGVNVDWMLDSDDVLRIAEYSPKPGR